MQFVQFARIFGALILVCSLVSLSHGESVMLRGDAQPRGFQQIRQKVDIQGHLKLNPHGKGVTRVPLTVTGNVDFHQRVLNDHTRVRHYQEATAQMEFGEGETAESHTPSLRDARRTVCLTKKEGKDIYFAPTGTLQREELELIDTPACRLDLIELLPERKVSVGQKWQHDSATLARLLNLDTVGVNQATSQLDSIKGGKATILLEGTVDGAVGGVATEIELKAKYQFSLQSRRVVSLSLAYREQRELAPAEPGFEVVAKLAMAETSLEEPPELSNKRLANLDLRAADRSEWLEFASAHGGYRLYHSPGWQVLIDQPRTTIFRYVEDGTLLAQLNLARLPRNETEAAITLEAFSEQAGKALADNLGQLLESRQYESPAGDRVLRVEANGMISDIDVRWIYYHISNREGLRASCVVTVEEGLVEKLGGADQAIIDTIELVPLPADEGEPTPAKTAVRPESE